MRAVFVAAAVAFVLSIFGTPIAIRLFTSLKADQPIRTEGPQTHLGKKGTPTMGGVVFIFATFVAYLAGHLALDTLPDKQLRPQGPTTTAVVLLGLFLCTGLLGFWDDYLKVTKRNSLGLNKRGKLIGQAVIGAVFGIFALYFPKEDAHPLTVASSKISFVRDIPWLDITKVGAVLLFVFVVMAMSNAVNLTDGLDGLATGTSVMVLGSYALIAFWQYRHWVADDSYQGVYAYDSRDPLEIALIAASAAGACVGFLWWNAAPARIFMGDTGSMGLGALIAGLAAATKTVMLLPILTILYFIITVTWVMQIGSYRTTGKRIFRMVPLQHHFELAGWSEVNIVIRFWIIAGLGIAAALGLFYADFLRVTSGSS
ncbi:phospho-N-acetylmuramoyl-pentapeptide-transferase [Virgisporangium aliadipatigenens]|uniref:Phospho-N-acetylmuramoyl-pentapeptide-transferase n=1 Tax=Virgisporangium aliadipatigenens TaxID=741659 RepID=A0A8J3YUD3_9ACTN|nr:phospho-N-acetylmuramoyl-pentapeptide-transferase [Virgisporangium aliadipatigenens]GIJ49913.1 phospho-N-acetylmuramoyl-pentapeptide-transferase [Virgisporangium aliadipatigenens]